MADLQTVEQRLGAREKTMLGQITNYIRLREAERAWPIAKELSEVRKLQKRIKRTSIDLEAAVIRLSILAEYMNFADTMGPVAEVLRTINDEIHLVPSTAAEVVSQISAVTVDTLSKTNLDAIEKASKATTHDSLDEGVTSILKEAEKKVEQDALAKLPQVPADLESVIPAVATARTVYRDSDQLLA